MKRLYMIICENEKTSTPKYEKDCLILPVGEGEVKTVAFSNVEFISNVERVLGIGKPTR